MNGLFDIPIVSSLSLSTAATQLANLELINQKPALPHNRPLLSFDFDVMRTRLTLDACRCRCLGSAHFRFQRANFLGFFFFSKSFADVHLTIFNIHSRLAVLNAS